WRLPQALNSEHPQLIALECELASRAIDGNFVLPRPAGGAAVVRTDFQAAEHSFQREINQAIDFNELANLLDRSLVRDQFFLGREVDSVEAGMTDWWAGDAQVNLLRAGAAKRAHLRARGRATHNRIVHDDDPFVSHQFADDV